MSLKIFWIDERLGMMPVPHGGELLPGEIARLSEQGVNMLVSLLGESEVKMLGLEKQPELCEANGIRLMRFPIDDFSVPVDNEAALLAVREASEAYRGGMRVVIHCRGGIGRSSLFAGALLVKGGEQADKAFGRIGKCRGCKVPETELQALWLRDFEKLMKKSRGINNPVKN
jgi:hypothetical protein